MKAVRTGFRAFGQEFRNIKWSTNLDQKTELMNNNTSVDFDLVNTQKSELGKILVDVSQKKRNKMITSWKKSYHVKTECAKQLYLEKYKPSLVTVGTSFGISAVITLIMGPECWICLKIE